MHVDEPMIEADRQARRDALDVRRSFIVQAPAGSGKTELLIQRYLALLAIVEQPEEVLAITFTRKASAEMRERVVNALMRARAGEVSELEHEQTTLSAAASVLEQSERRDWQLIESPRRMRIMTLDAFCASTARALPLTAGLGGSANTVQGADATALHRAAALATLDWLVGDEPPGLAVEQVLSHLDNNTYSYVEHLARMLQTRDQWLEITGSGELGDQQRVRQQLEKNIADIVQHQLGRARRRLLLAGDHGIAGLAAYAAGNLVEAGRAESPMARLRDCEAIPAATPENIDRWRGLAELLHDARGRLAQGSQSQPGVSTRRCRPEKRLAGDYPAPVGRPGAGAAAASCPRAAGAGL